MDFLEKHEIHKNKSTQQLISAKINLLKEYNMKPQIKHDRYYKTATRSHADKYYSKILRGIEDCQTSKMELFLKIFDGI